MRRDLKEILERHPLDDDRRQLCLTSYVGSPDPLREGAGRGKLDERMYRVLNEEFVGTEFETFYRNNPRLGRVRLMLLPPKTCYSFHQDPQPRLHVALHTNEQCFIALRITDPPENHFSRLHVPADGKVYWVDTRREHTAMNGSLEPRIHLVANVRSTSAPIIDHDEPRSVT